MLFPTLDSTKSSSNEEEERSAFKSCAEDKETVGRLYVRESKINSVLAL